MALDDFDLDRYTPYLVNRAGLRIAEAFEAALKPHRLSLRLWRVLAALWHYGETSQIDLARHTSIDASTLSRMVGGLARRGLVARAKSDTDSRAVRVRLTERGRALTKKLIPTALEYERISLDGLSEGDVLKLREVLHRLYGNMERLGKG